VTKYEKSPPILTSFFAFSVFSRKGCLQVCDVECGVEESTILKQLLAVPSHNSLRRYERVWVHHGRSRQQRNVRSINVPGVEGCWSLESHEDFAIREQWVLVELHSALQLANVEDSEVDAFGCECVGCSEVVQLLELG